MRIWYKPFDWSNYKYKQKNLTDFKLGKIPWLLLLNVKLWQRKKFILKSDPANSKRY